MPDDIMTDAELTEIEARAATALSKLDREGYDTWVEVQQPTYDIPPVCASHRLLQDEYDKLMDGVRDGTVWGIRQLAALFAARGDKSLLADARAYPRAVIHLIADIPEEQRT